MASFLAEKGLKAIKETARYIHQLYKDFEEVPSELEEFHQCAPVPDQLLVSMRGRACPCRQRPDCVTVCAHSSMHVDLQLDCKPFTGLWQYPLVHVSVCVQQVGRGQKKTLHAHAGRSLVCKWLSIRCCTKNVKTKLLSQLCGLKAYEWSWKRVWRCARTCSRRSRVARA